MLRQLRTALPVTTLLTVLALAACDAAAPAQDVTFRDGSGQGGPIFNTPNIFTSEVPAVDTQGQELAGVTLLDVEIFNGAGHESIDPGSLAVDQGTLIARVEGSAVEGEDFILSRWTFKVDGDEVTSYLTTVETADDADLYDPASPDDLRKLDPERLVYTFEWMDQYGVHHDTCVEDVVGGARTVLYGDIVVDHTLGTISARPNSVYFGCISGAVGKASLWGYAPDSPSLDSVSLAAFTTATRVVRDDVCADGVPHTDVGNPLTLRDRWEINDFAAPYNTEAVWEVGGRAKCVRKLRSSNVPLLNPHTCADGHKIPLCANDLTLGVRWNQYGYGDIWTKTP
jgi:hypothetical protein